jgi:uncharacterized protein YciI
MFVIELVYKADLSEIDAHMSAHVAFLKKHYAAGNFVMSGRRFSDHTIVFEARSSANAPSET